MIYKYEDEMKKQNKVGIVRDEKIWNEELKKMFEKYGLKEGRQRPRDPNETHILPLLKKWFFYAKKKYKYSHKNSHYCVKIEEDNLARDTRPTL